MSSFSMSKFESIEDILFFEPHQGRTCFSRLVCDFYRRSLIFAQDGEGDVESRSHDWMLGVQSCLSVTKDAEND